MGRNGRSLIVAAAVLLLAAARADELPASVRAELARMEDFSFSFSQPGFYAVLEAVRDAPYPPGHEAEPEHVSDWHVLLERPAEYRGRAVTVEGVVGRNAAWELSDVPDPQRRTVWQLELARDGQPIACTVILTADASDVPIGASVTVTGYFVMVRQYYTASRRVAQAALLVGRAPTRIARSAPPETAVDSRRTIGFLAAIGAGLAVAWVALRHAARMRRPEHEVRARRPAPLNLSQDLAQWVQKQHGAETHDAGAPPNSDDAGRSREA
ncbi:MAG: hypothetical protein HRF50_11120 [Phycisphaerae bacterium]|jgi:hypothetical protein